MRGTRCRTMGSMSTTRIKDLPPRLQDRYGYRRTPVTAIVIATALQSSSPPSADGWRCVSQTLRFDGNCSPGRQLPQTTRPSHSRSIRARQRFVECVLRVQDKSHHDVGYAIVTIPPGTEYSQTTYEVATRQLGFAAEVLDCATAGNLHGTDTQFPPGTSNPPLNHGGP